MYAVAHDPRRVVNTEPLFAPARVALLCLLAALGVVAFIFSAISPLDDDSQQEFLHGSKPKLSVPAHYQALSNLRTFRIRSSPSALTPLTPQFASYDVTAGFFVRGHEIKGGVCSSRTGDRSPPSKSNLRLLDIFESGDSRESHRTCTSGASNISCRGNRMGNAFLELDRVNQKGDL